MKTEFNTTVASKKREAPFSLRLTFEERNKLKTAANGVPLGTFIKCVLFDRELPKVRRRHTAPVKDHQALAQVLAALGQSRLSANLNQMARAVNTGTLPVHPETEGDLRKACAAVQDMRQVLLEAFGKDGGPP